MAAITGPKTQPAESPEACSACGGMGWRDVGDCEDGVIEVCSFCEGCGVETPD